MRRQFNEECDRVLRSFGVALRTGHETPEELEAAERERAAVERGPVAVVAAVVAKPARKRARKVAK